MIHSTKPYTRAERLGDQIKSILGDVFLNKVFLKDTGLLTITKVNLSPDLKNVKIFVSFIDNKLTKDEIMNELNFNKKNIRYHMAKELHTKYVPEIHFHYDNTFENASRIDELLRRLEK